MTLMTPDRLEAAIQHERAEAVYWRGLERPVAGIVRMNLVGLSPILYTKIKELAERTIREFDGAPENVPHFQEAQRILEAMADIEAERWLTDTEDYSDSCPCSSCCRVRARRVEPRTGQPTDQGSR